MVLKSTRPHSMYEVWLLNMRNFNLCRKNVYLFININFVPFKTVLIRYNALVPSLFPIFKALLECSFLVSHVAPSSIVCILSVLAKHHPFMAFSSLRIGRSHRGPIWWICEYRGPGIINVLLLAKKYMNRQWIVSRCVIVVQLPLVVLTQHGCFLWIASCKWCRTSR